MPCGRGERPPMVDSECGERVTAEPAIAVGTYQRRPALPVVGSEEQAVRGDKTLRQRCSGDAGESSSTSAPITPTFIFSPPSLPSRSPSVGEGLVRRLKVYPSDATLPASVRCERRFRNRLQWSSERKSLRGLPSHAPLPTGGFAHSGFSSSSSSSVPPLQRRKRRRLEIRRDLFNGFDALHEEQLPQPQIASAQEQEDKRSFGFRLAYSDDWIEAFDRKLTRLKAELEEVGLSDDVLSAATLSIVDAGGSEVLLDEKFGKNSSLGNGSGLAGRSPVSPVSAQFPLCVTVSIEPPPKERPIEPARLREAFLKNLEKPPRKGSPMTAKRIAQVYQLLVADDPGLGS